MKKINLPLYVVSAALLPLAIMNCVTDKETVERDVIKHDTVSIMDTVTKTVITTVTKTVVDTQYVYDTTLASETGKDFELRFYPRFGDSSFALEQKVATQSGDSVRLVTAKFFVSEFALIDTNGAEKALPGLGLIDFSDSATRENGYGRLIIKALAGSFRGIKFSVGVPYDLNHRDVSMQKYPLGPDVGMFWVWNSGYIFHMVEGKVDSADSSRSFFYHVGTDNRKVNVQFYNLPNPYAADVKSSVLEIPSTGGKLEINVDYAKIFSTGLTGSAPMKPSMNENERAAHGGPLADRVFSNMQSMFTERK